MSQRSPHLDLGRKVAQPLQSRLHLSDTGEAGEETGLLRSRLRSLGENEYKSLVRSSSDLPEQDATSQELFRKVMDLVTQTQTRVLGVSRRSESEKTQVLTEFRSLSDGLWSLLFKVKLRTELPGHLRDWIRKTVKLEDEKRSLELQHEDALDSLSQEMQRRTKDLQQELTRLQQTNTSLEDKVKTLLTQVKAQEARESRARVLHSLQDSAVRSSALSLNSSASSLEFRHSRKSSTSLIEQKLLTLREEKAASRSVSPADRALHGLKAELQKSKSQLESCQRERDILKAWKEQSIKREMSPDPRQADLLEQEKKRLTSKALILQHRLNLFLLAVPRFIRVSSSLLKASKDRDLVATFENSRAELEVLLREHQGEVRSRASPSKTLDLRVETLERENRSLEKELKKEKKRSGDFAEALDLTNKTVELLSGKSLNPVQFMQQLDGELKATRARMQTVMVQCAGLETQLEASRSLKQLASAEKTQIQRQFETTVAFFSGEMHKIAGKIEEKDQSLTRLKTAVLNRLQEQLRALIQVNDLLSRSGHSDDTVIERLREEKDSLEALLTASQEWAAGKVQELQTLLDNANFALAESQAQIQQRQTQGPEIQALIAKSETADLLQTQLAELRMEQEQVLKRLSSQTALLAQKEAELTETCYEKQRFEEQNRELLELDKQRSEDWIAAQETFQRELAEAARKLEEADLDCQKDPDSLAALRNEVLTLQSENERLKQTHHSEVQELERAKAQAFEELDSERVKIAALNRELVARNVHVHENKRKAEQLSADIESRKKEQETAMTAMEGIKVKLEKSCKDREEAIKLLSEELLEQQRKLVELQAENMELLEKWSLTQTNDAERPGKEIDSLKAALLELNAAYEELKTAGETEKQRNAELEKELRGITDQHEEEMETLQHALISDSKRHCLQYEAQIEALKTEGTHQREQFEEDLSAIQGECQVRLREMQEEVQRTRGEIEALRTSEQRQIQLCKEAREETDSLTIALTEEKKTVEALKVQLSAIEERSKQQASEALLLKQEALSLKEELRSQDLKPSDLDSEPQLSPSDSLMALQDLLSAYSAPQDTLVSTVTRLLDECERLKKSRGGVVIPRLHLRTGVDSKEVQTSPRPSDPVTESADQDTPRQKLFPELVKKRVSAGIQQAKTEELYLLHNRIRDLERDLDEEAKLKEHAYSQLKVFKEELAQRDRSLQQAAQSPGLDHLKDVVTRLLTLIPKDQHRNSPGEALVNTTYSLLGLTPSETNEVEQARRTGKKGLLGFLNK